MSTTTAAAPTTTNGQQTTCCSSPVVTFWAQRADKIFLTLQIQDCKKPDIKLEKQKLTFVGKSDSMQKDSDNNEHKMNLVFFNTINTEESKFAVRARGIEFVIIKEEPKWWPRLLKDTVKQHWLRIDFPKWKDEDDTDDEAAGAGDMDGMMGGGGGGQPDFSQFMQQFGNASGGMPGMGGMPGDDDDEEEEDEDDEDEPAESKMPDLVN